MERPNSKGRTFTKGCAPSRDLRTLILDETVRNAGDINTDYFPGKSFLDVANALKASRTTVINLSLFGNVHIQNIPLNNSEMGETTLF